MKLLLLIIWITLVISGLAGFVSKHRCSKCGKLFARQTAKKSELDSPPLESKKWEYLYRCKYCGYEWTEKETEYLLPSP